MKLKAKGTYLAELPPVIREALFNLEQFVGEKNPERRAALWKNVEENMEGNDLSTWCVLFVRFILRYVSAATDEKFIIFFRIVIELDVSHVAELTRLRAALGGIGKELDQLQKQQDRLLHSSYSPGLNVANILEQDAKITEGIGKLDKQMQSVRGLCLILEKIVAILRELKLLQRDKELLVKQTIAENPVKFIVNIIPILSLLQKGNSDDLQTVIQLTLALIGLEYNDDDVATIKQKLDKEYLQEDVSGEPEKPPASSQTIQQRATFFYTKPRTIKVRRINQLTQQMDDLDIPDTLFEKIEEEEEDVGINREDLTETVSL
jgi:hypothetical protein